MSDNITMTTGDAENFAIAALTACGATEVNARGLAAGIVGAELDGVKSHGYPYLPIYCEHLLCGKVKGDAEPKLRAISDASFVVDADNGFAHPAINAGLEAAIPAANAHALAAIGIRNSYNCGVLGFHTGRIARAGLLGIGFTNAPASIAPVGGRRAVIGTNPFSVAVPDGYGGVALLIDQSASVVAKSELSMRAAKGDTIPEGWAFGPDGEPTTDPAVGLKGTMAPSGGYKGFGIGLLVELMAAALTGATLGVHASSFANNDGGPPATGQFFLLLDPQAFSAGTFGKRVATLLSAIGEQEEAYVPGSRRAQAQEQVMRDGIEIPLPLQQCIQRYIERSQRY